MPAPKKYNDELRERATRLAVEARRDPASAVGAIRRIAGQLGVYPEALPAVGTSKDSSWPCAHTLIGYNRTQGFREGLSRCVALSLRHERAGDQAVSSPCPSH